MRRPECRCRVAERSRVRKKGDRVICKACDVVNRFLVLQLAVLLRDFDAETADLLVAITGYKIDDDTNYSLLRRKKVA